MASTLSILFFLFVGFLSLKLLSAILAKRQRDSKAAELGCKPPPAYPQPRWDVFGLRLMSTFAEASGKRQLPRQLVKMFHTLSEQQGRPVDTMKFNGMGENKIFTKDPKNIQAILATHFEDFEIGSRRIDNFVALLGYGIFTSNGVKWSHQRAMLRPCFARDQINDLQPQERHVNALLSRLPTDDQTGWTNEVDLAPFFKNFTLDHATEFLFGESTNSQTQDAMGTSSRGKIFGVQFDLAQDFLLKRFQRGKLYWTYNPKEFRDACKMCNDFIDDYVSAALAKPVDQTEKDIEKGKKYVLLDELALQTRDPVSIREELFAILLAGRDTTSSLLGFLWALLARHPDVFAKLRTAVINDFGEQDDPKQEITFSSLKSCSYLQHTLSESLRLHPSVPHNSREATRRTTLPQGGGPDGKSPILVEKGTSVDYMILAAQVDAKYWGNDVNEFKPERWVGRKSSWEFLPFNGGPRVCLGQQFALTTAGYVVVRMLQSFDKCENMRPEEGILEKLAVTNEIGNGTWVRLHAAGT